MKRLILLLLPLVTAFSQSQPCGVDEQGRVYCPAYVLYVASDPTGSCSNTYYTINQTTGNMRVCKDGTWSSVTGSGSGAPTDARYLTSRSETDLSAEVNLGALTTGMLRIAVSGGVATPSTAVAGTHYAAPTNGTNGQALISNGAGGFGTPVTLGGAALLAVGTTAGTVAAGNDARLSNARTPTAHAGTHASGQADAISPASIGAEPALGNPAQDNYVLQSTAAGERSWVAQAGGHTQGTDTSTTSPSFQVDSSNSGPRIKNNAGVLEVRNAADNALAELSVSAINIGGGTPVAISPTQSKGFTLIAPVDTDDYPVWIAPYAVTILSIKGIMEGTTNVVGQLQECDTAGANCADLDSDITFNGGVDSDDGSLTDSSIASGAVLKWKTTSVSGTPTSLHITFTYQVVPD